MSAAWLLYVVSVSALLALAARTAESVALLAGHATRWVWAVALGGTLLVPLGAAVVQRATPPRVAPVAARFTEDVSAETPPTSAVAPAPPVSEAAPGQLDGRRMAPLVKMPASAMMTHDSLALGWAVLSLSALLCLISARARLARARTRWHSARLCGIDVLVSRDTGPAAIGIRRPAIVVPEWLLSSDPGVQRLVVHHECEHLWARDPLLLACGSLAVAMIPWNPLSWWMLFRLRSAVEVDCDLRVLASGADTRAYTSMLLGVADRGSRLSFAVALIESRSLLERRVRVMTRVAKRFRGVRAVVLGVVALTTAGFAVRTEAPVWRAWTVSSEPVVDIGAISGDPAYLFHGVSDARRLPDGRIVVANGGTFPNLWNDLDIRVFDAEGRHVRTIGRTGRGPGEFATLSGIDVVGDSIYVYDQRLARVSIFRSSGELVTSFTVLPPGQSDGSMPTSHRLAGVLEDRTLVFIPEWFSPAMRPEPAVVFETQPALIFDGSGDRIGEVGEPMGVDFAVTSGGSGGAKFGRSSSAYVGSRELYMTDGGDFEVRVYEPGRGLVRTMGDDRAPRPVTREDVDLVFSAIPDATVRRRLMERPRPEHKPWISGILVDSDGFVWARVYEPSVSSAPETWEVFDPSGAIVASVRMPPGFQATQIGSDYVIGLWKDTLDVEHVRVYALTRS